MAKESKQEELTSENSMYEKMYRLGYEDARNKREYGESLKEEEAVFTYQGQKMEQLKLF